MKTAEEKKQILVGRIVKVLEDAEKENKVLRDSLISQLIKDCATSQTGSVIVSDS